MKKAKIILDKILRPPVLIVIILPVIAFAGLIYIFATDNGDSTAAYVFYALSAYSLAILVIGLPKILPRLAGKIRAAIAKKSESIKFLNSYLTDKKFKSDVKLCQGAIIDALYSVFKLVTGIIYSSVWFVTLAVYHLVLGILRVFLVLCGRKSNKSDEKLLCEYRHYNLTARLLLLLSIPMSGMIVLMVLTNSGFTYPGYVIYLSAMYTFYKVIMAAIDLKRFKKVGSPILSAGKAVNFTAAITSVLGLQTAMIAAFSENNDDFRLTMNAVTGAGVMAFTILIAFYMIIKSVREIKIIKTEADAINE